MGMGRKCGRPSSLNCSPRGETGAQTLAKRHKMNTASVMRKLISLFSVSFFLVLLFLSTNATANLQGMYADSGINEEEYLWKAGISGEVMTPEGRMWLGGYSSRNRPAEGTMQDLWVKALALEDKHGERVVLVTTDMVGMPKDMSDRIRKRLNARFKLSKAQIILNSSHTHSGPVLIDELHDYYAVKFGENELETIRRYAQHLENKIISCVEKAIKSLQPVYVFTGNGLTRFQVNRYNNAESEVSKLFETNGPNDYAVPVLKVQNLSGKIISIVFGYACHATVASGYLWSPDYPGYARIELEKRYPGTTAIFFQGCGGDQNPLPRRSAAEALLAQQYGKELAAAVECVIEDVMTRQPSRLKSVYTEIDLPFSDTPTLSELKDIASSSTGYERIWAGRLLEELEKKGSLMKSYPYPIQIWMIGKQPVFSLGGEVVIAYAQELKRMYGYNVFVMGYNNDVMAYIPSSDILQKGGYEGARSLMYFNGVASGWDAGIEFTILSEMQVLAEKIGLRKVQRSIIRE